MRHHFLPSLGALGAIALGLNPSVAKATSDAEIAALRAQIRALEARLDGVQRQNASTARTAATASAKADAAQARTVVPVKAASFLPPDTVVRMPNNRPTICTTDGFSCAGLTGQLHFDAAAYDYRPNTGFTSPQQLNNGVNARRARVGIIGTFARDFDFGLILDGGGTTDGIASLNKAYITYRGFKSFYNLSIEGGYIDVPYTLDQATSSNNTLFMERASPNTIATSVNAGDSRSAFGARMNDKTWWAGAYITGPSTGTSVNHSQPQPLGFTGRAVVTPISTDGVTVLIGGDVSYLAQTGGPVGTDNLTLSDRIEVRVDPSSNALLSTGALANVDNLRILSAEAAVGAGSFYAQGEYFDYRLKRFGGFGESHFTGGYGEASYVLTGESRKYSNSGGAFGGINPKDPFVYGAGGYGAWEIAGRYSYTNLNDLDIPAVRGGVLTNTTLGLNWYPNSNIRFMFNWIHGKVDKADGISRDVGASYDVFAMRSQFAF
jgi:phosphate-selective porin OprO/OprP